MITLKNNQLLISFPEVHSDARATIELKRTLRIPDDGQTYPLPPGFENFELRHVEDYAFTVPPSWRAKGGVMTSMYQSEALWLNFHGDYPIIVKIGTGKINAVTGGEWTEGLSRASEAPREWRVSHQRGGHNYVVIPRHPWRDGYCVEKGLVKQFVAMPLGKGATVEEQMKGSTLGGIQIQAFPLKAAKWKSILEERRKEVERSKRAMASMACSYDMASTEHCEIGEMGIAAGGRMHQKIYEDRHTPEDWDITTTSRCWIHICNSESWEQITEEKPPHPPYATEDYTKAGLPWFEYYSEGPELKGSQILNEVRTVSEFPKHETTSPFPKDDISDGLTPFDPADEILDEEPPF